MDGIIIPEWRRLSYWEGEWCEVELFVSHFSTADLAGSRLEWWLEGFPSLSGHSDLLDPPPASVTSIGRIRFRAPDISNPMRARLLFRLTDGDGVRAKNELELLFYPRSGLCADALRAVERLGLPVGPIPRSGGSRHRRDDGRPHAPVPAF